MTARKLQNGSPPGISIALMNEANAGLLDRLLGSKYRIHHGLPKSDAHPTGHDLLIIDATSLHHQRQLIQSLRSRSTPVIFPVLLIADNRAGNTHRLAAELEHDVDDILRIPTSRSELCARVDNLLRLRSLSRRQEEARHHLEGVVSALHTLNACDTIVVRSQTEQALIRDLCRTIVDEEGYSLAWVGFSNENQGRPVSITAWAGPASGFIHELEIAWAEDPSSQGSVAATLRTGKTQTIGNIIEELPPSQARESALTYGLNSAITLPLNTEIGPPGCLSIYSNMPTQFGAEELQLLERLADNLAFGINALRARQERERQATEIHDLAFTDALTGLPNRRHLINYLDSLLRHAAQTDASGAVMFIDLDGFKLINDALGHKIGDRVLKQIAQRLQNCVRDDDLVVRHGGDEFLVVVKNRPRRNDENHPAHFLEGVTRLADRIIAHVREPLSIDANEHHLKASVGISVYPDHGSDATSLIENADKAMYEAKQLGGNRSYIFTDELSSRWRKRLSMEARLYRALEQEEFQLHYQPIFALDSCQVVAVEALIRWPQDDGSMMSPGAFMPVVEETELIKSVGAWVLETAARQLRLFRDQGLTLDMAVNISPKQIHGNAHTQHFTDLVHPHVDPRHIQLEVTENALMSNADAMEELLEGLREAGFRLAIDDFGTGYSSLSRLQNLPIHTIKIDRSFVARLDDPNSKGAELVTTIQRMTENLGLQSVAEGIETDTQRQRLLDMGTRHGQGFWFSPAVPADELVDLLGNTRTPGKQ